MGTEQRPVGRALAQAIAASGRTVGDMIESLEYEEKKRAESMDRPRDFVPDLDAWSSLAEEVSGVPPEVGIAFMTGRPNLILGLTPERLAEIGRSPEQLNGLVDLVRVLIATNQALQRHCERVAQRADDLAGAFRAVGSVLQGVRSLAHFQDPGGCEDD